MNRPVELIVSDQTTTHVYVFFFYFVCFFFNLLFLNTAFRLTAPSIPLNELAFAAEKENKFYEFFSHRKKSLNNRT